MPTESILAIVDGVTCEVLDVHNGFLSVRALEGKPWKTCSFLRHHRGITFSTAYMTFPRERVEIHPDTLSRWGVTDKDGYGNPIPVVVETTRWELWLSHIDGECDNTCDYCKEAEYLAEQDYLAGVEMTAEQILEREA